jgi:hypothetical protein
MRRERLLEELLELLDHCASSNGEDEAIVLPAAISCVAAGRTSVAFAD